MYNHLPPTTPTTYHRPHLPPSTYRTYHRPQQPPTTDHKNNRPPTNKPLTTDHNNHRPPTNKPLTTYHRPGQPPTTDQETTYHLPPTKKTTYHQFFLFFEIKNLFYLLYFLLRDFSCINNNNVNYSTGGGTVEHLIEVLWSFSMYMRRKVSRNSPTVQETHG